MINQKSIDPKLPLVSVLICNYNYGKYIDDTLESVLNQSYKHIEIVIVDDGSTDESKPKVEGFVKNNPNIVVRQKLKRSNEGICYARNDALEMMQGEYFLFLDSDDTVPADYISKMVDFAEENNTDVVYGDSKNFGVESGETNFPEYDPDKLLLYNLLNISSLVRASSLGNHRFDLVLNRKTLEDYDFWLGLSLKGSNFIKIQDLYLNYRIHNESRNENAASQKQRINNFVDAWLYCIEKYRLQYPEKIPNDIYIQELKHQVDEISNELMKLNTTVQAELLPELHKREEHIKSQHKRILILESEIKALNLLHEQITSSREYRTGKVIASPYKVIKNRISRPKGKQK